MQSVEVGVSINKHLQEGVIEFTVGITLPVGSGLLDEPNEVFLGLVEAVDTGCTAGHLEQLVREDRKITNVPAPNICQWRNKETVEQWFKDQDEVAKKSAAKTLTEDPTDPSRDRKAAGG